MNRLKTNLYRVATLALLSAGVGPTLGLAQTGTIHFSGMIVAPPFEIHVVPTAQAVFQGGTTDIEFVSPPANKPSASVRVDGLDKLPFTLRYTDVHGRMTAPASMNAFQLGQDGGTLSVALKGRPAGENLVAMVTTTYD